MADNITLSDIAHRFARYIMEPTVLNQVRSLVWSELGAYHREQIEPIQHPVTGETVMTIPDADPRSLGSVYLPLNAQQAHYDLSEDCEKYHQLTSGQRNGLLAALHDVYCHGSMLVLPLSMFPATLGEAFSNGRMSEFHKSIEWTNLKRRIESLGEWATQWFERLLWQFERELPNHIRYGDNPSHQQINNIQIISTTINSVVNDNRDMSQDNRVEITNNWNAAPNPPSPSPPKEPLKGPKLDDIARIEAWEKAKKQGKTSWQFMEEEGIDPSGPQSIENTQARMRYWKSK